MSIDLRDCRIETTIRRTLLRRRRRWTVQVFHEPSGIEGAGLDARSYEEARDGAVRRIESLLQRRETIRSLIRGEASK